MTNNCYMCGIKTPLFFVWSTSRNFPREKLYKARESNRVEKLNISQNGVRVCFWCLNELKKIE